MLKPRHSQYDRILSRTDHIKVNVFRMFVVQERHKDRYSFVSNRWQLSSINDSSLNNDLFLNKGYAMRLNELLVDEARGSSIIDQSKG